MRLSLGAILYFWPRASIEAFYEQMSGAALDTVYLGETVCAKRRSLKTAEWIELAVELAKGGKQIVLSTLALIEAGSELGSVKRLCSNGELLVEANDMGAVQLLAEQGLTFIGGAGLNIYNAHTLRHLYKMGMRRWVMPVELSGSTLSDILGDAKSMNIADDLETEIFSFGRLPLAYSARCFTARHHKLAKDECELKCIDYPEGLAMHSQEGEEFFTINGIQTQSGRVQNLLPHWHEMADLGVDLLRISPQPAHTFEIVQRYREVIDGRCQDTNLQSLASAPLCDGYWRAQPGMDIIAAAS